MECHIEKHIDDTVWILNTRIQSAFVVHHASYIKYGFYLIELLLKKKQMKMVKQINIVLSIFIG